MEHHFNVQEAELYGIECAILLYNIRFWINKNKANGKHYYKGMYWTYNSAKAFAELFPYISKSKIARHLRELEDIGILVSDNFNSIAYDKTKWYSILDNPTSKINNHDLNMNNPSSNLNNDNPNLNNPMFEIEQPIPYNKTDNKHSDNKTHILVYNQKSFKNWTLEDFENEIKLHRADVNLKNEDLINFYNHWVEKAPNGKMRFQLERTWQTNLRLKKWEQNKINWSKGNTKEEPKDKMKSAFEEYQEGVYSGKY